MFNLDDLYEKYGNFDLNRLYESLLRRESWRENNREHLAEYRREYRKRDPDKTRKQWKRDTARYRSRKDPEELRARNRQYHQKHDALLRAMKKYLDERKDAGDDCHGQEG